MVVLAAAVLGVTSCSASSSSSAPRPAAPTSPSVDGLAQPIGLGLGDVYFSWRQAEASAYRIEVSQLDGSTTKQRVVWNSGAVRSTADESEPYAGPALAPNTVYSWRVQIHHDGAPWSAWSRSATFETGLRDSDWKADWIWRPDSTTTDPDQYTYARKEATLDASPIVRARAFVSADQQYEMYVNGTRVGKGEAYSYPDTQYYETLDVTHALRAGTRNALGLLYTWDGPTKGHPAGEPGVIAEVVVQHRDGRVETIGTDGTWRVLKGAWLAGTQRDLEGDLVDYKENIFGPAEPLGWEQPHFDDTSWAPATVRGAAGTAPWTHLVSVRTRIVEQPIKAVSLRRLPTGAVVADFGKVYAAVPTVTFHHGVRGRTITMRAGYLLDSAQDAAQLGGGAVVGDVSAAYGVQHTDMSYTYVQRGGGVEQFHPVDYLGFRYLQIDNPGETLTPSDVVALARHTEMPDAAPATFSSSNATVDAIFQLGAHSSLYTAQEQFVDTPTREKGSWLYDGFNESVTAMSAFGDQNATRKSLMEFAQSQSRYWPNGAINKIYPTGLGALDINESSEIYAEWVWQYWLHTGDRALLQHVYPVLQKLSDYVANSIDPKTDLVTDLPATNVYYDSPTVTRLNILGANVFRRTADVGAVLHRPANEVSRQNERADALTSAINKRLTRPNGTYADGLDKNGKQVSASSQTTNACAVVYGVAPKASYPQLGAAIAKAGMSTVVQNAAEVLNALARTGRDADLVRILADPHIDGWANILARGATFTWEVWNPSDIVGDSMSHGWGSNVLVAIQRDLLGVTPTSGAYATFTVQPPNAGLDHASGTVPTPNGPISVQWSRTSKGVTVVVTVPDDSHATVFSQELGPGRHTITSRG